jgi:signal transduction histidine kinase
MVLFVVMALVGVSYIAVTYHTTRNYYLETTQRLNATVAEQLIREVSPFVDGKINESALGTIMHSMMAVNPTIEVYLLDTSGNVLSFVVLDKKVILKSVDIGPIKDFMSNKNDHLTLGDDPRNPGKEVIFSAAPVLTDNILQGYVYLVLESEEQEKVSSNLLGSHFVRLGAISFTLTLLVAFLLGSGLIYYLVRKLRSIHVGLKLFEEGDYHHRIKVQGNDELDQLAASINAMSDKILMNIEELKKVDVLRRDLIANVSHDLRSPMTVIHGYVETFIMKQEVLTEKEQKQYLNAILNNSIKLNKLVNDLFELSKLEAKQIMIQKATVPFHEVLHEMCEQFALIAQKKKITISSNIPNQLNPIEVDAHLLNRAVQNILDNAIKYTDDEGSVEVSLSNDIESYKITVTNTGEGIGAEDLPHIFDRYYKASQNIFGQSTGLGLAIAQKIVQLHGGNISVVSNPGFKTAFTISLPMAQ